MACCSSSTTPGSILPGVVGAICLLVALYAFQMLPINYAGLALIVVGIAFMVAELFVTSYGALGVGGAVAFLIGSVMLIDTDVPGYEIPWSIIATVTATSFAFFFFVIGMALQARRRPVVTGGEQLIGASGEIVDHARGAVVGAGAQRELAGARRGPAAARAAGARHRARWADVDRRAGKPTSRRRIESCKVWAEPSSSSSIIAVLFYSFRVLREYERGVVFQLGRFWKVKGPGLVIVIPAIQQMVKVDLRTVTMDVPPQDVISRDNVSVKVSAVIYFRVVDPERAIIQVENYLVATSQLAQTTLRSVLGKHELDQMLAERDKLNIDIQHALDQQTDAWGIKVANVEIKQVDLNETMIRAIARQAEAERERRSKVILAEGELQASQKLLEAAQTLSGQPEAMQLRYLQTLNVIASERSNTIVFPIDLLGPLTQALGRGKQDS